MPSRRERHLVAGVTALTIVLAFVQGACAETADEVWLPYAAIQDEPILALYDRLPAVIILLDDSAVSNAAGEEILRGVRGMLGRTLRVERKTVREDMLVLGTQAEIKTAFPGLAQVNDLEPDGYWLKATVLDGQRTIMIAGRNDRGVLYGSFALLRKMALHQRIDQLDEVNNPYAPIRWVNQWDNLDGSIERGYAGRSIFFERGEVVPDLTRVSDYGRLLGSVGIDGCTVNNVNADPRVLSPVFLKGLARIADAFRPWGVKLSLAVDFSSPKSLGGLATFDPLNPAVSEWWNRKADEIYRLIPDFAGFVLKADSEGRLGPSIYGRTHAEAANALARAVAPHGGVLIYRAFVYNHHLDWRNLKNDRARAAYDNFQPLDGRFDDNVVLQIKYGPIDFQAREPVSPLIGALRKTNEALELQITQEYTGQQRHLCFLVPMWKEMLDSDLQADGPGTPVKQLVSGKTFHRPLGGMVGVANVGRDVNWLGSDLAMANLYGFGRLAWDPNRSAEEIVEEWTMLTFGDDAPVVESVRNLQLES
ncbi:MAG: glucosiduronase, partial [Acidobacteriaceae bacterium]|nr:glucosiduronase [Acidobacteriaceae bacterium]